MKLSSILRLPAVLAAVVLSPATLVAAEHTSNWAVLVSTSRFWFNYRHLANVLSIYRTVKRLGIPDSQIILMLPDDMACNPRNAFPGTVYSNADRAVDLYGDNIEVDYRGYEVTVENFIRLLTDRVGDEMPRSKRLLTDDRSNILVYMTGHGGNEFLKFQDAEEIGAYDLADAFEQMWEKKRYHEILFMIDTCQANTMYSKLYSPNIIATGSSELDQSSYSHHADNDVGVAVIDRYTYYNLEFLETQVRDINSKKTVGDLFDSYDYEKIHSHAGVRYDLFRGGAEAARSRLITDFFGNVQNVEVDGTKNTTLEEDLLSLSKTIAALKKHADEIEAAERKANETVQARPDARKKIQFAKPLTDDNWWTKKLFGATAVAGSKIPLLREISLTTRPLTKRAVSWSCDGELAVAADDSVHVFVPLFPDPVTQEDEAADDDRTSSEEDDYGQDDDDGDLRPAFLKQRRRKKVVRGTAQFASGNRQILVSHPRLHPRVNRELFEVAGLPFPGEGEGGNGVGVRQDDLDVDCDETEDEVDGDEEKRQEEEGDDGSDEEPTLNDDTTFGAGKGVISSAGSTLNHVVSIAWSPSGLGRNRRPILAVLTSAGYIGFYGDNASAAKRGRAIASISKEEGTLKQRDLSAWGILFGVGERLIVPGQQTEVTEKVASMAWASEIGPGQALLAYINDDQEVAILSIQSISIADEEDEERTIWRVDEVVRFEASGPHPPLSPWDLDWVPTGTCFGLRWSPWLNSPEGKTCVLSCVDRNYVGFRKITLATPWAKGSDPDIKVDTTDTFGLCLHLSTDSFVEFEDAIWTKGQSKVVRGLVVTGLHVKPFEVSISGPQPFPSPFSPEPHPTSTCRTTYLDTSLDRPSTNPIVDLIVHPPDMMRPSAAPTYTLVRLSATSTNHDWFQTNAALPEFSSSTGLPRSTRPQWATELAHKLAVLVPADAHMRHTAGEDEDEEDLDSDAVATPEVHPTRFRLHGLAAAPGGKATAVLVSAHSTQTPDRTGWWGLRSVLLFGALERPKRRGRGEEQQPALDPMLARLTTEGRTMNWMYGGGADVPGVTAEVAVDVRTAIREMFKEAIASQRCDLCGAEMAVDESRQGMTVCTKGHFWSTCGASGLAIQAPGISHTCGVCGVRTLKIGELLKRAPRLEEGIKTEVTADACGKCGGKFVD
ncbi:gpi-anchor transamidase-like protein [Coniochaeta sp. 2T2.1]|nr:gpi-anchor transamidase-like protein [Coniochaeta sp. 2T2.1]